MRIYMRLMILFSFLASVESANAFPRPPGEIQTPAWANTTAQENSATAVKYDFAGTVALKSSTMTCSGSLVRFRQSEATDKALILTNGHCAKWLRKGEIVVNEDSTRTFEIIGANGENLGTVTGEKLLYATMTKTDLALFQLKETIAEIENKFHVSPFVLGPTAPAFSINIEILSGLHVKGYSCKIEAEVFKLYEGEWVWEQSLRYSRPGCEIIAGTSGSPVVAKGIDGIKYVIGVNSTINEKGLPCSLNNPCEIDAQNKIFFEKGVGYAQQTFWLYSCLDSKRNINLNQSGCMLPKLQKK